MILLELYALFKINVSRVSFSGVHGEVWIAIEPICFPLCGQMLGSATHSMEEINCCRQLKQVDDAFVFQIYLTECKCENYHAVKKL